MRNILRLTTMMAVSVSAAVLTTGCLGPRVLKETVAHVPAAEPNVELRIKTNAPSDVLVIYTDHQSNNDNLKRRAFYLYANQERLEHGQRPHFVKLAEVDHLEQVPVFKVIPADMSTITNELYAFEMSPRQYWLESHGRVISELTLPEYEQWFTAKKLFLFPGAVGADAIGLGAVAGVTAAYAYAGGGANPAAIADALKGQDK